MDARQRPQSSNDDAIQWSKQEMGCSRTVIVHYGDPSPTVALANQLAEFDTDVVVVANDRSTRPDTLGSHAVWQIPERNLGYGLAFMAAVRDCTSRACVVLN